MKHQTELLKFAINPSFLELMKQPEIEIGAYLSFNMTRMGVNIHCTLYTGEEGLVIFSRDSFNVILRDHCKTPQEFASALETLDGLLMRFPPPPPPPSRGVYTF